MTLKSILIGINDLKAKGDLDREIKGIESNSKNIKEDYVFVAIKGFETDGHKYISNAIENGAKTIVVEEGFDLKSISFPKDVTVILAKNTREFLAISASNFYDNPSKKLKLIGVTGTKGKTTTTFMIKEILEKAGKKVGLIGTIAIYINGEKLKDSDRTTPESLELQQLFSKMLEDGVEYVARYCGRPAISENRIINYDGKNVTYCYNDHKDESYHEVTLTAEEFIALLVRHLIPYHFKTIRYYGFYRKKLPFHGTIRKVIRDEIKKLIIQMLDEEELSATELYRSLGYSGNISKTFSECIEDLIELDKIEYTSENRNASDNKLRRI